MLNKLAEALEPSFATKIELDKAISNLVKRHGGSAQNDFSISKAIRGLVARSGQYLNPATREEDLNYAAKALATGSTPGTYLIPTVQANDIVDYLTTNGVLRKSGVRIWPMAGIQKLTVPVATGVPTVRSDPGRTRCCGTRFGYFKSS